MKVTRNKITSNQTGITLIALVITIIVLLILAGVAISMLAGDNGILRQAAKAKEDTKTGEKQENTALGSYESEINKRLGIIPIETDVKKLTIEGGVKQKTKYKDESSKKSTTKTAVIPEKFKVSDKKGEQNIDTGLVVIAPDGSEFVWVPVDDPSTMYETKKVTQVDGTQKEIKVGKLYNNGDINIQIIWSDTGNREPALLSSNDTVSEYYNTISGYSSSTEFEKDMQNEFNNMIKSVEENKGFYVARYECSLREENGDKIIQSVRNVKSATAANDSCNKWYGLYKKNKEYSEKNDLTDVVGSSMIWGSQYDQMLIWMNANEKDVTAAIGDKKNKGTGSSVGTTGTVETDKINNIFDLYGNAYEWTLEADSTNFRVLRRRYLRFTVVMILLRTD